MSTPARERIQKILGGSPKYVQKAGRSFPKAGWYLQKEGGWKYLGRNAEEVICTSAKYRQKKQLTHAQALAAAQTLSLEELQQILREEHGEEYGEVLKDLKAQEPPQAEQEQLSRMKAILEAASPPPAAALPRSAPAPSCRCKPAAPALPAPAGGLVPVRPAIIEVEAIEMPGADLVARARQILAGAPLLPASPVRGLLPAPQPAPSADPPGDESSPGPAPAPTLTVGRLSYKITKEPATDGTRYHLRGPRGAHYATMRNARTPDVMFVYNERGMTPGPLEGVWFTDEGAVFRVRGGSSPGVPVSSIPDEATYAAAQTKAPSPPKPSPAPPPPPTELVVPAVWRKILSVRLSDVPVSSLPRRTPKVDLAAAVRKLLKQLGLPLRVLKKVATHTAYVEVYLPGLRAPEALLKIHEARALRIQDKVRRRLETLLVTAFPEHDDRSDSHTDYFDSVFSVTFTTDDELEADPHGLEGLEALLADPPADSAQPGEPIAPAEQEAPSTERAAPAPSAVEILAAGRWESVPGHVGRSDGWFGRVTKARMAGVTFYTREAFLMDQFMMTANEREGLKRGKRPKDAIEVLELCAPEDHWDQIARQVQVQDPLHRPIRRNQRFTVAWAEEQLVKHPLDLSAQGGSETAAVTDAVPPEWAYTQPPPGKRWPQMDTRPPAERAAYVSRTETEAWHRAFYFDGTQQIGSSRDKPVEMEHYPWQLGTWRIWDDYAGTWGAWIEQLREVDPQDVLVAEHTGPERMSDVERYAAWMAEGRVPPPIEVNTLDDGRLRLAGDGHRRRLAAIRAGKRLWAWVQDAVQTGQKDSDGEPMFEALTFELINPAGAAALAQKKGLPEIVGKIHAARRSWGLTDPPAIPTEPEAAPREDDAASAEAEGRQWLLRKLAKKHPEGPLPAGAWSTWSGTIHGKLRLAELGQDAKQAAFWRGAQALLAERTPATTTAAPPQAAPLPTKQEPSAQTPVSSPSGALPQAVRLGRAQKLRAMADTISRQIEAKRQSGTYNQTPTPRRSRIIEGIEADISRLEKINAALLGLAAALEGRCEPPSLEGVVTAEWDCLAESLQGVDSRAIVEDLLFSKTPPDLVTGRYIMKDLAEASEKIPEAKRWRALAQEVYARCDRDGWRCPIKDLSEVRELEALARVIESKGDRSVRKDAERLRAHLSPIKRLSAAGLLDPARFAQAKQDLRALLAPPAPVDDQARAIKQAERELLGLKIPGYFPTPRDLADRLVEEADIQPGMKVLEPSAGKGDIAQALRQAGVEPDVIELQGRLREILTLKGFNLVGSDFLDFQVGGYDRIVGNPPFEDGQDADHVRHAYELLRPGGRLVMITSEGLFFRKDRKATEFRTWLKERGGRSEKLPEGAFLKGDRPTGVSARYVVIDKPAWTSDDTAEPSRNTYIIRRVDQPDFVVKVGDEVAVFQGRNKGYERGRVRGISHANNEIRVSYKEGGKGISYPYGFIYPLSVLGEQPEAPPFDRQALIDQIEDLANQERQDGQRSEWQAPDGWTLAFVGHERACKVDLGDGEVFGPYRGCDTPVAIALEAIAEHLGLEDKYSSELPLRSGALAEARAKRAADAVSAATRRQERSLDSWQLSRTQKNAQHAALPITQALEALILRSLDSLLGAPAEEVRPLVIWDWESRAPENEHTRRYREGAPFLDADIEDAWKHGRQAMRLPIAPRGEPDPLQVRIKAASSERLYEDLLRSEGISFWGNGQNLTPKKVPKVLQAALDAGYPLASFKAWLLRQNITHTVAKAIETWQPTPLPGDESSPSPPLLEAKLEAKLAEVREKRHKAERAMHRHKEKMGSKPSAADFDKEELLVRDWRQLRHQEDELARRLDAARGVSPALGERLADAAQDLAAQAKAALPVAQDAASAAVAKVVEVVREVASAVAPSLAEPATASAAQDLDEIKRAEQIEGPSCPADQEECSYGLLGGACGLPAPLYLPGAAGPQERPARYCLIDARKLKPSHNPLAGFTPTPGYPKDTQERVYQHDKAEQEKVYSIGQKLKPAIVFQPSTDGINGPPITTEDGIVLGGNGRAQGLIVHYAEGGTTAKEYLLKHAPVYGFSRAQVERIEQPVIVRVLRAPGQDLVRLVRLLNIPLTQGLDAVGEARRLSGGVLQVLAAALSEDQTLAEYLSSADSRALVDELKRSEVITARNVKRYLDDRGLLNPDGRQMVERLLAAALLPDAPLLDDLGSGTQNVLARGAPYLLAASTSGPEWDLRSALRAAAKDLVELRRQGAHSVSEYLRQGALLPDKQPAIEGVPLGRELLEILYALGQKPLVFARFAQAYARAAAQNPAGQGALFAEEKLTPMEALRRAAALAGVML